MKHDLRVPLVVPIPYRDDMVVGYAEVDESRFKESMILVHKKQITEGSLLREVTVMSGTYQRPKPKPAEPGVVGLYLTRNANGEVHPVMLRKSFDGWGIWETGISVQGHTEVWSWTQVSDWLEQDCLTIEKVV